MKGIEEKLCILLRSFDWEGVRETCQSLVERLREESAPPDERTARRILDALRTSRQFASMSIVAEAFLQAGQTAPQVRRQYAQSLIDLGYLTGARSVLDSLVKDPATPIGERLEAIGLIGRIHKQAYVNAKGRDDARRRADLSAAVEAYGQAYRSNPEEYLWHGINMVALMARSGEEESSRAEAERILRVLEERERDTTQSGLSTWDLATRLETYVALGGMEEAESAAADYLLGNPGAFELGSTLRQLQEVWGLNEGAGLGSRILPVLRAALLKRQGGGLTIGIDVARHDQEAIPGLEKRFGPDKAVTLAWYSTALSRCTGIARIEKAGRGVGTGWLVRASDFFDGRDEDELLLLTNAHVVATNEERARMAPPRPLLAQEAKANFQWLSETVDVESVVWLSPVAELDASFVRLKAVPDAAKPLPISDARVEMAEPPPRMYVIGYPGGRDLEVSLHDNQLVGCNETRLHYRSPTEPGSSGSPVFEPDAWRVVALHHLGRERMERLDDPGETYQANEGVSVLAIRAATATRAS